MRPTCRCGRIDSHELITTTFDQRLRPSTTGHEWDGIKELNTPLPRWWVLTFYATIVWAIGYWVVYPTWPLVSGLYALAYLHYTNRAAVAEGSRRARSRCAARR